MRQVSQEFRNAVQRNTNVAVKATLALADGTELDLVNSDFVIGSVSFDEATSSTGSFDIGSAIVGQFKATIANYDGKFSRYDFSGSTITPSVGTVVNGTMEWLQIGVYDIDRPTSTGRSIEIQAYDKLNSMKVALNTVGISYPTTLGDIALKLCDACGVTLESSAFPNNDYQVKDAPRLVDSDTCLSGIAWVAQIACCYVKCSNLGHIVLDWYDPADFKDAANLDGGTFNTSTVPYSDGDTADGGTFDDYSSGVKVDAGEFSNRRFLVLARNQQSKVSTDDVTITGVSVTAQDEETSEGSIAEKGETALSGKTGYVLSISGNKFVSFGTAQRVADLIAPNVVGLKFRTFSASTLGNPVIECGDAVYVTDYTANVYRSYITQLTYTVGSYESVACNAETPTHNAAINASAATKTLQETRALVANERSSREAALSRLSDKIAAKAGLYQTVETLGDGSKVFYLHDAETVGRSKTIWKMNAQAIAVSVDGGKSYTSGISADGNAILNRIYAVGIDASHINSGTYTVTDSDGNVRVRIGAGVPTCMEVANPYNKSEMIPVSSAILASPISVKQQSKYTNQFTQSEMVAGAEREVEHVTIVSGKVSSGYGGNIAFTYSAYESIDTHIWDLNVNNRGTIDYVDTLYVSGNVTIYLSIIEDGKQFSYKKSDEEKCIGLYAFGAYDYSPSKNSTSSYGTSRTKNTNYTVDSLSPLKHYKFEIWADISWRSENNSWPGKASDIKNPATVTIMSGQLLAIPC